MTTLFIEKFMNHHLSYRCNVSSQEIGNIYMIMHVENAVPENQYIEKYMNILIAQIIKFKLLDITFIIFKYCIRVLIYSYLKVCF